MQAHSCFLGAALIILKRAQFNGIPGLKLFHVKLGVPLSGPSSGPGQL